MQRCLLQLLQSSCSIVVPRVSESTREASVHCRLSQRLHVLSHIDLIPRLLLVCSEIGDPIMRGLAIVLSVNNTTNLTDMSMFDVLYTLNDRYKLSCVLKLCECEPAMTMMKYSICTSEAQ